MMRYRLVLWDFDGTLADTLTCTIEAYNRAAGRHGFRRLEDVSAARSLPPLVLLRSLGIPLLKLPSLVAEVLEDLRGRMAEVRLFPGIAEVLRDLHAAGRPMSILSSNARENILTCLRANEVERFFESVVGYRRLFGKGRPLRRLLRARGVAGHEAVYIGDEVRDIEAARQAGMGVVAVTWGYQARTLLEERAPDHLIDRPDQVLSLPGCRPGGGAGGRPPERPTQPCPGH